MKRLFFIIFSLINSFASTSQQEHPILNYFNIDLISDKVYLNWEIQGGNQCNGINVFRSTDGVSFESIGDIQGICGGSSNPESYSFIDETPISNAYNFYRIELGNQGFSSIDSVLYISLNEAGYRIMTDYNSKIITVKIDNSLNEKLTLELYHINGQKLKSIIAESIDNFQIKMDEFGSGFYLFRIIGESKEIKGKIMY